MAQYLVKHNGKFYANRDLVKVLFHVGDAGLLELITRNKITSVEVMDRIVYQIASLMVVDVDHRFTVCQDLDAQIAGFGKPLDSSEAFELPASSPVYKLSGISFVPAASIYGMDPKSKSRIVEKLPYITFLGGKYIALSKVDNTKECLKAVIAG